MSFNTECYSIFQFGRGVENEITHQSFFESDAIKKGRMINFDREISNHSDFFTFIDNQTLLVPAPRSAPLVKNAVWPAMSICRILLQNGYGSQILPLLERVQAVPPSHLQRGAENRTAVYRHCETISCESSIFSENKILIVDDIITQGRTLAACRIKIKEQYPESEIILFTAGRTMSFNKIERVLFPKKSMVRFNSNSGNSFVDHRDI